MNGMLRVRRSRGVLSGLLLVLLGIWGALVPFVGPYFHYAYTPDKAWTYTSGRLWLEILPGAAAALGGLIVLASAYRPSAHFGAWLAALSGAWFALGGLIGPTWIGMHMVPGTPVGGTATRAPEQIGFFTGLGIAIVLLAAMAVGRFSVISVSDAKRASRAERRAEAERAASTETAPEPAAPEPEGSADRSWRDRFVLRRRVTTTDETDEPVTEPATTANS
jgi:MFS family permease